MSRAFSVVLGAVLVGLAFMEVASVLHMPHLSLFAAGFGLTIGLYLAFVSHSQDKKAK